MQRAGAGVGAALGGLLGFADGGVAPAGRWSVVGERGPELFVPRNGGAIVPNGGDVTVAWDNGNGAAGGNMYLDAGTGTAGGAVEIGGTSAALRRITPNASALPIGSGA